MTNSAKDIKVAGRVEGGIDAIVIGGTADGLTAAAYLARAGLHTILVDAQTEFGGTIRRREIAPGITVVDGEHLIGILDADAIADLDLYRHGLEYAARCLDTAYFFENAETLLFDGDLQAAPVLLGSDQLAAELQAVMPELLGVAEQLRPVFEPSGADEGLGGNLRSAEKALAKMSPEMSKRITRHLFASVDDILGSKITDGPIRMALACEAVFRSSTAPNEAFSLINLLRRYAGEIAGLQAATAYPAGGVISVIDALRRAAQAAKVDIRAATPVRTISIEADCVAGIVLENGGQLRAPVVVSAVSAKQTFLEMIGASLLDIEFHEQLVKPRALIGSARLHLTLKGVAKNDATKENMTRRLMFAPSSDALRRAFAEATAGKVPEQVILEVIFPNALDEIDGSDGGQLMSVMAHPMPLDAAPDEKRREAIANVIIANLEQFTPGIESRKDVVDLQLPADLANKTDADVSDFAARPSILQQLALSGAAASASHMNGLYFCGPEAQIGDGVSCAAGRAAAMAALRDFKKGVVG